MRAIIPSFAKFFRKIGFSKIFSAAIFLWANCGLCEPAGRNSLKSQNVVRVSDFGAVPNDGKCDIAAIRKAFEKAASMRCVTVKFDAGVYDLSVGQADVGFAFVIKNCGGLSIEGVSDKNGNPLTKFLRRYEHKNNMRANAVFKVSDCKNLTVKNIILDNFPRYFTAGEVVSNNGKDVLIKTFEGNPSGDGTLFFCANLWDIKSKSLKNVGSLTFGGESVTRRASELTLHTEGNPRDRIVRLSSAEMAKKMSVGDGVSWNFGWKGSQMSFARCENLHFENVYTYSSLGFCIFVSATKNVSAKNVKFIAQENQFHVGSRDAFMLSSCSGKAVMDGLHIEGVRWDGQNVNSIILWPQRRVDKNTMEFANFRRGCPMPISAGGKMFFRVSPKDDIYLTVSKFEYAAEPSGKRRTVVTFKEDIPPEIDRNTPAFVQEQILDSYCLVNSSFRNIAGCASLIRQNNVLIKNCSFERIMYPAICIGASLPEDEGPICENIRVENCSFKSCGWQERHGAKGCIAVSVADMPKIPYNIRPVVKNVKITGNKFSDSDIGAWHRTNYDIELQNNEFKNVKFKTLSIP